MGKTFSGIKSIRKNFKGGGRQQNKEINDFLSLVVGCALGATKRSMNMIARRGLSILVDNNNYSDYTGVLRNSYQAAIIENGNVENTLKKIAGYNGMIPESNKYETIKNTFSSDGGNVRGKIILLTSEGIEGTVGIQIPNTKMIKVRLRRNANSPNKIHNRWAKMSRAKYALRKSRQVGRGRKLQARQHGYGRVVTQLKGVKNLNRQGYTIVFSNPTPYTGRLNEYGRQVIPTGLANSQLKPIAVTITKQEIENSIKRAKDALRKRNTQ